MKSFEKRLGRKGDFLDIGCGRGELIWAARESQWNYQGIDPSEEFIDFGREHLGIEGKVGTLDNVEFAEESFDAIAMGGIIEHLYEPREVLKKGPWLTPAQTVGFFLTHQMKTVCICKSAIFICDYSRKIGL